MGEPKDPRRRAHVGCAHTAHPRGRRRRRVLPRRSAWLFGSRASDEVLDSAKADQVVWQVRQPPTLITVRVVPRSCTSTCRPTASSGRSTRSFGRRRRRPASRWRCSTAPTRSWSTATRRPRAGSCSARPLVVDAGGAARRRRARRHPGDAFDPALVDPAGRSGGSVGAAVPTDGTVVGGTFVAPVGQPQCGDLDCPAGAGVISIAGDATTRAVRQRQPERADFSRSLWIAAGRAHAARHRRDLAARRPGAAARGRDHRARRGDRCGGHRRAGADPVDARRDRPPRPHDERDARPARRRRRGPAAVRRRRVARAAQPARRHPHRDRGGARPPRGRRLAGGRAAACSTRPTGSRAW